MKISIFNTASEFRRELRGLVGQLKLEGVWVRFITPSYPDEQYFSYDVKGGDGHVYRAIHDRVMNMYCIYTLDKVPNE